jgi:hypothetical protein
MYGNNYHLVVGCRWWALWEAMSEVRDRPLSTQKTSMAGTLGGGAEGLVAFTINKKN